MRTFHRERHILLHIRAAADWYALRGIGESGTSLEDSIADTFKFVRYHSGLTPGIAKKLVVPCHRLMT
jgi:hypothetical protein